MHEVLKEQASNDGCTAEHYLERIRGTRRDLGCAMGSTLELSVVSNLFQRSIELYHSQKSALPEVAFTYGDPSWPLLRLLLDWSVYPGGHYDILLHQPSAPATDTSGSMDAGTTGTRPPSTSAPVHSSSCAATATCACVDDDSSNPSWSDADHEDEEDDPFDPWRIEIIGDCATWPGALDSVSGHAT